MKSTAKKLLALLLAMLLLLSMCGLSEEAIVIEDNAAVEEGQLDNIPVPEGIDLAGDLDILDSLDLDAAMEAPKVEEEATPEEDPDDEAISDNALVTSVKLGVNEKYIINTSSLSGKLTFKSSKPEVANVNNKGIIKGKKVGIAKISVTTAAGKKYKISVTVAKAPSKVTLNKTSATLEIGDTLQLKATLPKKTASNKMTWTSSNKNVATVSDTGKVTAKAAGSATITVKTFNGKKATCKVTVEEDQPEQPLISVDKTSINLSVGDTATVEVTYTGDDSIYWSSSTSGIVDCQWSEDWYGDTCELYITGKSAGSTVVKVEDRDAGYSVSISVTVTGSSGYTGDLLSGFGMDFDTFRYALDDSLIYYKYDSEDNVYLYYNDYMMISVSASTNEVKTIFLAGNTSGKYTLCGIYPGINFYTAQSKATAVGWSYYTIIDDTYYYTARYKGQAVVLAITKQPGTSSVKSVMMFED